MGGMGIICSTFFQDSNPNLSPTRKKKTSGFFQSCVSFNPKSQAKTGGETKHGVCQVFLFCWWWQGQIFSHFHPDPWEKIPFLTHMFQVGWFNHQLVTWKQNICGKIAVKIRFFDGHSYGRRTHQTRSHVWIWLWGWMNQWTRQIRQW